MRSSPLAAGCLLAVLACRREIPATLPRPAAVQPAWGYQALETPVTVLGDGFEVEAYQTASGAPAVDASFRAWLGPVELGGVEWVSTGALRARVPAGLAAGTYRLEVEDPRGARGALDAAFTVVPGAPVPDEAAQVAANPFGDGTSFSFVFGYADHVFLGPSGDGRGVVRCLPDGSGCESWALHFQRDVTALVGSTLTSVHQNPCADYLTLGSTTALGTASYCDPDNPWITACFCGPNLEAGRGLLGSFRLGADEWLVAIGRSKKRFLRYLYMTRGTTTPLDLSYVDATVAIPDGASVEDVVSMAVLDGRLYVGLQVDSAERPRMIVVTSPPAPPGLDATASEAQATTFTNTPMGEAATTVSSISQVDALAGFAGRLFVANRRAVLVSRSGAPDLSADPATQFDDCTPLSPAGSTGWEATSIARYAERVDVTPAQMGVTGLAEWQGRLYLARNTLADVPELWAFTPRRDALGNFLGCAADRSDWRLVATTFGDPQDTKMTALFASASHLYVGFDNAVAGVKLFRTAAAAPAVESDFTGRHGCTAPCEPFGRAGFGDATNTRFFDGRAIPYGLADQVWTTVGAGNAAVRVYRLGE